MALDTYIVTLPDGSQGDLMSFYESIMDESIQPTDAGYVLSDGSLIPTNGEAIWNPDEETLIALMTQYLLISELIEEDVVDLGDDTPPTTDFTPRKFEPMTILLLGAVGYMVYMEYAKK